jgi:hypothetical protein
MMLAVTAYEFFVSVNGGNVTFVKTVTPIENKLGTEKLYTFTVYYDKILVPDDALNNK